MMDSDINMGDCVKYRRIPFHGYKKKEVIIPGMSVTKRPREGSRCLVSLNNVSKADSFDCNHSEYIKLNHMPCEIVIVIGDGDCETDRGIETALCDMSISEVSNILLNQQEDDSKQLTVQIKLIQFSNVPYYYELTNEMKLQLASTYKDKGKLLFNENRIIDAFHKFSKAVKLIIPINVSENDVEYSQKNNLYISLCNNLALCQLHFKSNEYVVDLCKKVLEKCPQNIKCLMRRTDAYINLRDFENAHADALKVLSLDPDNMYIKKQLIFINKNLAQQHECYVRMVKQMFITD